MGSVTFSIANSNNCENVVASFTITKTAEQTLANDFEIFTFENLTTGITYTIDNTCPDYVIVFTTETDTELAGTLTLPLTCFKVGGDAAGLTELPDGIYEITGEFTLEEEGEDDENIEYCVTYLSLCELCCKVKKLAANVDLNCGCCNDDCAKYIWQFLEAHTLLTALQYSGICGSTTEISINIKNLQLFLKNVDCSSC